MHRAHGRRPRTQEHADHPAPRPVARMPGDHIPGLRAARAIVPGRAGRLELGGVEDAFLGHEDIAARHLAHYDGLGVSNPVLLVILVRLSGCTFTLTRSGS